jgi:hypothetical protein
LRSASTFDDAQADLGEVAGAHVAGHPLALDDARRVRARRDRAGLAVRVLPCVSGPPPK